MMKGNKNYNDTSDEIAGRVQFKIKKYFTIIKWSSDITINCLMCHKVIEHSNHP